METQQRTILRRKHLPAIIGLSLASIDRLRANKRFPEPVKLTGGQAVGWFADVIQGWLASRELKTAN